MTTRMKLAALGLFAASSIAAAPPYTHPRGADNAAGAYANCVFDKAEDMARARQPLAATRDAAMSACVSLRAASLAWQSHNFNASKERSQDDLDFIATATDYSLDKQITATWNRYNNPARRRHS